MSQATGRARHHGAQQTDGNHTLVLALEEIRDHGRGPCAEAVDAYDLPGLGEPHHDWGDACDIDQVALHHAHGEARGDTGIDGIAAGIEDRHAGLGGKIVPGGDGMLAGHDRRPTRR